jgi:hypothetical protein
MPNLITVNLGNSKTILEGNSGIQGLDIDITLSGSANTIVQVPIVSIASVANSNESGQLGSIVLNRVSDLSSPTIVNLDFAGGSATSVQGEGGTILAPFLVANGSVQSFLADVKLANVYLGNVAGKSADGFDHVRLLGDNKFAFEDLWGGGDGDYTLPRFNSS